MDQNRTSEPNVYAEARAAGAYGFWQLSIGSTGAG